MRVKDRIQIIKYVILPMLGILFLGWYVKAAAADVVYSDYIRLINEYLPDVEDLSRLFVPDILTRIPITFLARVVNVSSFGYSVTFDRVLTIIGLGMMAGCLTLYSYRKEISFKWQIAIYIVLFSLNKWEILLNGTAWAHVFSFGLFFIHYMMFDLVWTGEATGRQEFIVCFMPIIMLLFAGEYIVSYACTMIIICMFGLLTGGANSLAGKREKAVFIRVLINSAIALGLYMLSRHFAVWEHSGATELTLIEVIQQDPMFIPRFFVKTFAGVVFGQETIANFFASGAALPDPLVMATGAAVLLAYILAAILYFQADLMEKTVFPLILLVSGIGNHALVTLGRWIFLKESYALSSRYAGQFMIGVIGFLLVFAMYDRQKRNYRRSGATKRMMIKVATICVTVFIILGNCYTTYQEIRKSVYREANYMKMSEVILHYEDYEEEELMQELEWHKDPETLYHALEILKDNKLNVFSKPHFEQDVNAVVLGGQ